MTKFFSLLEFEFGRLLRFLIPTLLISAVMQFISLFSTIARYKDYLKISLDTHSPMELLGMHDVTGSGLFPLAILMVPLLFVFYSLFTWYREWLGKNTFIYRLMMLPIHRMSIFFSKALTFILGGLLAFVTQFGLYAIISMVLKHEIHPDHFTALQIHNVQHPFEVIQQTLFPTNGLEFLNIYGFAFAALLVLFSAILMERSFGIKGAIMGLIYIVVLYTGYFSLTILHLVESFPFIIRPSHIFLLKGIYMILMMLISSFVSHLLLKNKVRV